MNTRRPRSRPDLVRFMEDISMPILERPLPDPVEDCYREQMKTKILLDQEDIESMLYFRLQRSVLKGEKQQQIRL